jgi:hypothetical protein
MGFVGPNIRFVAVKEVGKDGEMRVHRGEREAEGLSTILGIELSLSGRLAVSGPCRCGPPDTRCPGQFLGLRPSCHGLPALAIALAQFGKRPPLVGLGGPSALVVDGFPHLGVAQV